MPHSPRGHEQLVHSVPIDVIQRVADLGILQPGHGRHVDGAQHTERFEMEDDIDERQAVAVLVGIETEALHLGGAAASASASSVRVTSAPARPRAPSARHR